MKFLHQFIDDAPIKAGLVADQNQIENDYLSKNHLIASSSHATPGFAIGINAGHGTLPIGRYGPEGFWQDVPGTLASLPLPPLNGVIKALEGFDWKNARLPNQSQISKLGMALLLAAEGGIMGGQQIHSAVTDKQGLGHYLKKQLPTTPIPHKGGSKGSGSFFGPASPRGTGSPLSGGGGGGPLSNSGGSGGPLG